MQLEGQVAEVLQTIQASLFDRALAFRQQNTHDPKDYEELTQVVQNGWALSWWCGSAECEARVKEDTKASTRCIPLEQSKGEGTCIVCGSPSKTKVIFARSY